MEFDADELPTRPVPRTGMLIGTPTGPGGKTVAVLDLPGSEFVRIPGIPSEETTRALCLAPDGTAVLLLASYGGSWQGGLCLHNLATGQQQWFDARAVGQDVEAALSPDGRSIATLTLNHDDEIVVTVIDIATGGRRQLWSMPGGTSAESTMSWSPDGRLIAATYLTPEDEWASVIVAAPDGSVIRHFDLACLLRSANGAWSDEVHVLLLDEADDDFTITDVHSGTRRPLPGLPRLGARAALGTRILGSINLSPAEGRIVIVDTDGTNLQTVMTASPWIHLQTFDIAPTVLLTQLSARKP